MRDRALGSTLRLFFNSTNPDAGGAPVAPSSAFAAADIRIYKDGSATEKTTTNGITVTSPFDAVVGLHLVEIDTSNNTGDSGFWASGSSYSVRIVTAKTVATYSVSGLLIGEFSIELQTADVRKFGGTAGTIASGIPEVKVASMAANTLTAAAISADAGAELAALVETYIVNEGDATAVMQAIANLIAADWVAGDASPLAIAAAVRTNLATELARIDAAISTRLAAAGYTAPATPTNVSDAQTAILAKLPAALESGRIAAALDSASLVRFVTEDTGETVAAAGSVAKLAQGTGGGSTSVTVLPAVGIVASRSPGVTLLPVVGETISQSITVYQTDGTTPVDLSGKTLKIIFETLSGADVAVVPNADISISGTDHNVVTFAYPSAVTATERSLRFALRDAAAPLTMYLQGVCSVVSAPKVDA